MLRDLGSAAYVRQLLRKAEEKERAPAYLHAAPGIPWWTLWLYFFFRLTGGRDPTAIRGLAAIVTVLPMLMLSFVTVAFGLASLVLMRVGLGYRLLLFAINVSGPMLMLARP